MCAEVETHYNLYSVVIVSVAQEYGVISMAGERYHLCYPWSQNLYSIWEKEWLSSIAAHLQNYCN